MEQPSGVPETTSAGRLLGTKVYAETWGLCTNESDAYERKQKQQWKNSSRGSMAETSFTQMLPIDFNAERMVQAILFIKKIHM